MKGPVFIDLEGEDVARPDVAPAVPDVLTPTTIQNAAVWVARPASRLAKWFWSLLIAITGFVVSLAAWDYINGLLARSPVLGMIAFGLVALFCLVLAGIALKEIAAFSRLRRLDKVHAAAASALVSGDLAGARDVIAKLEALYKGREDAAWGLARLAERRGDVLDADGLLGLAETTVLAPLDAAAEREVEAAARQVAAVTAIVPLALADVFTALTANLRMIRRIAEIYGGRSGTFGSWRLTRTVLTHLVATGAVAVGDDLIGTIAGGGMIAKVSRRFGEGIVNGALTARVGVAALEVCRPLPYHASPRPTVTGIVKRALTGLFGKS